MPQARISVPRSASRGEVIEIKTLIQHPMETGFRRDLAGDAIPVHIIERFICTYNGKEVFRADFHPAVAANPYLTFHTVATEVKTEHARANARFTERSPAAPPLGVWGQFRGSKGSSHA
jgi:sulfur-oxidizing protein SoxZ